MQIEAGNPVLTLHELKSRVADFCRRHGVVRLEVFGSFVNGQSRPDSDIDLLVTFAPGMNPGLDFFALSDELEQLVGRRVDLLTRRSVEQDVNPIRRKSILESAHELYAA
jgi:hypothetical protein